LLGVGRIVQALAVDRIMSRQRRRPQIGLALTPGLFAAADEVIE
jgi:hypothetical protein